MGKFYGHFAAAYGTIWFCMMAYVVITQSRVNAGEFGLYGFPVIALIYAFVRRASGPGESTRALILENDMLRRQIADLEAARYRKSPGAF